MKKTKCILVTMATALILSACGGNTEKPTGTVDKEPKVEADSQKPTETEVAQAGEDSVVTAEMRAEADTLWKNFLDEVSVVETDNKYATILELVGDMAEFQSKYYATATNRDADEYVKMSDYEQLLWYSTYILPVNAATCSDYNTYCGSVAKWDSNVVGNAHHWFEKYGTQEMADAYRALMEWDYSFLMQTGSVYNFITGKTSAEENPNYVVLDPARRSAEQAEQAQQEVQQLLEELQGE